MGHLNEESEIKNGTSEYTVATPSDFPEEYNYGTGVHGRWSEEFIHRHLPEPKDEATVLNALPDIEHIEALYLWEKGRAPAVTRFSEITGGRYFDMPDFRPYVTSIPLKEGVPAKGAVVLLAGGALQIRANYTDTLPTAGHLRELGYRPFIVDYRLYPYTQAEGALDAARAVRFIRKNAKAYGIEPDNIAVVGYSAGGLIAGEYFLNYYGDITGTALDPKYAPDSLDSIPAKAAAAGMIYSFYGRLSVAELDRNKLRAGNIPPTFYCYGTEDPLYRQIEAQYEVMQEIGVKTKRIVLQNWPHAFGGDGGWIGDFASWIERVFSV